jgi:lipopolysaccharide/colanic/teichoic acid biosynthesis glycosyltransferase
MLDAQYAATISLHTDLRILMATIPLVVCGVGND